MAALSERTLREHLAREIKDETQAEIVAEMVGEWIESQAYKYLYFDDEDPCACGDQQGGSTRPREAMTDLAAHIKTNRKVPGHNSGECVAADDDEEDEDDD